MPSPDAWITTLSRAVEAWSPSPGAPRKGLGREIVRRWRKPAPRAKNGVMMRALNRLFLDHPREVGETYLHHAAAASRFGVRLARLSACAFTHAVMPGVHKTTVSDEIKRMADDLGYRAQVARECRMRDAGAFDPGL
jgi:hypothetical protein